MRGERRPSAFDESGKAAAAQFIEELSVRRTSLGLSQTVLAEMLGCNQSYIANIERGKTSASLAFAFTMEAAVRHIEENGIGAAPKVSKRRNPIGPPAPAGKSRNSLSKPARLSAEDLGIPKVKKAGKST